MGKRSIQVPFYGIEEKVIVGQNLKKLRNQKHMTQSEVAKLLNVNRTTYTKYETGVSEMGYVILFAVAKLFETDYNSIFEKVDNLSSIRSGNNAIHNQKFNFINEPKG
jgi:transcriptional regulator with XRE-family HTH domain